MRTRSTWRKIADVLLVVVLAGGVIVFLRQYGGAPVYTSVKVVDGDSLRDGVEEIRLHGIDAPEYQQNCSDNNGKDYPCGKRAARHLRKLVGNSAVRCEVIDTDRYNRTIGVCSVNDIELNRSMVEAGWALAYTRHSLSYVRAEGKAERARRGMWQGRFERPEEWRNAHRAGAAGEAETSD